MARTSILAAAAVAACAAMPSVAAAGKPDRALQRDGEPLILEGAALGELAGIAPERLVAFRYERRKRARRDRWRQVPVQVDERAIVDFGSEPPSNAQAGTAGTVYGTAPIGHAALQYTDPNTFVGPDADPSLDADDEVALLAGDGGEKARKRAKRPRGTWRRDAVRVRLADPVGGGRELIYLYRSKGKLDPAAGKDYVRYDFRLASGDYRTTYKRANGPNPESSGVSTATYEIGFSDRWFFDALAIAGGPDILDGFKFQFGPTSCGRSEATFNDAEGAFVANIDGPVRAIRSYVGANSGPLTQRTHRFYRDRHEISTDLRVHAVPGPMTYHDLSPAGVGMSYLNSANPAGSPVDGSPDAVSDAPAEWHLWAGAAGSLFAADQIDSSFADELLAAGAASTWYLDDDTPAPNLQCWGDDRALGQAGLRSTAPMPNTDPRLGGGGPVDHLRVTTTELLAAGALDAEGAQGLSDRLRAPLLPSVKPIAN
jgi:hypothetical protein